MKSMYLLVSFQPGISDIPKSVPMVSFRLVNIRACWMLAFLQ